VAVLRREDGRVMLVVIPTIAVVIFVAVLLALLVARILP
jgi:hypothetical protein